MLGIVLAILCDNATQLAQDLVVRDLANAESYIDNAQYKEAREILDAQQFFGEGGNLRERLLDLRALVAIRAPKPKEISAWVVTHFRDRVKASKDVRYRAWLAEALLAEGRMTEALATITPLQSKDLMPDAFAFVVVARLSIGPQREAALVACKARAKAKSICMLR